MGIVIIGMGEMGGVFGRAFLRAGHPVIPVTRRSSTDSIASEYPDPELALVAVGEADLDQVLDGLPDAWRNKAGLLQNELLPSTWESRRVSDPTVIVVWFEKKAGRPVKVIQPSPVFGPATALVVDALATLEIPTTVPASAEAATLSLVAKNLYILVSNIAGLVTGGSVGELWDAHRELAMSVASDVLDVQEALIKSAVPRAELIKSLGAAFAADPEHGTTGRSAPARLASAIHHAEAYGLGIPTLREIAMSHEL